MNTQNQVEQYLHQTVKQKEALQKQAEQLELINQELKKLSAVVRETNNAVLIIDKDGSAEWLNDAFIKLYGYDEIDLNAEYHKDLLHSGFNEYLPRKAQEAIRERKSLTFESNVKAKDHSVIEVQTTLTPLYDTQGELSKVIIIDTDIGQLKETERTLKQLIALKDKFFSIIAHDLKNPFNVIIGYSRLLVENPEGYSQEKLNAFHRNIYDTSQRSYNLLENLLEWSRSQTGRLELHFQPLNLYHLVEENFKLMDPYSQGKNIHLKNEVPGDIYVEADYHTLNTVLRNLITNGLKYSYEYGTITVSVRENNERVQVDVSDEGMGISEEDQDKLFRMEQDFSKEGTNKETGTGLGLILCKEFTEKNGGSIWVSSKQDEGSTFSFTLMRADRE